MRAAYLRAEPWREMWRQAEADVSGRLARIERGESTADARTVRVLRAFLAPDARGRAR